MNPVTVQQATPFAFGGAVSLAWINPLDLTYDHVKILRKTTDTISGPTDPSAIVIYTGSGNVCAPYRGIFMPVDDVTLARYRKVLDVVTVGYGTTYYYAIFACNLDETDISVAALIQARTPNVSAFEEIDILQLLIDYINPYMNAQIVADSLALRDGQTINVLNGPPLLDCATWPMVSVHLDDDHPSDFSIGDVVGTDDVTGDAVLHRRGYMSDASISVVGWTDNPDVRKSLYRNLKGCLISVRQLLEQLGFMNIVVSGRYAEDFESYGLPLFFALFTIKGNLVTSVREVPSEGVIATIDLQVPVLSAIQTE
ncbi:MAG: hypothetical protein Q7U76_13070 [Nitrospirota bacterium]|nr:hypothetical protein [Nitrospirota bacterium]